MYVYHSDISCYLYDCTVTTSPLGSYQVTFHSYQSSLTIHRLIIDWSVECMNPDMTPYNIILILIRLVTADWSAEWINPGVTPYNKIKYVVLNHVNSNHVLSCLCLDVWNVRQTTSGVYDITVTTSAYHSHRCGRL